MNTLIAFMGIGGSEMVVILIVVLLLFGAKKLPELARGLGQGIKEFKKASNEVTDELQRTVDEPVAPTVRKLPPEGSQVHGTIPPSDPPKPPQ